VSLLKFIAVFCLVTTAAINVISRASDRGRTGTAAWRVDQRTKSAVTLLLIVGTIAALAALVAALR